LSMKVPSAFSVLVKIGQRPLPQIDYWSRTESRCRQ